MVKIILASKSPRRLSILEENNYEVIPIPSLVPETLSMDLTPKETAMYLSLIKALSVAKNNSNESNIVVGADTIVVYNNDVIGKPKDKNNAREILTMLNGKTHSVISGVTIVNKEKNTKFTFSNTTYVKFKNISEKNIEDYLLTDEPYDKAGAYAIQGLFSKYIESYSGDYLNVVGFPLEAFKYNLDKIL